jgi:hypothetical protein
MPTATFTAPKSRRPRMNPPHADPFYGYGYNPNWPSILSVAHDESDGGKLFVITDRPCVLLSPQLPLLVEGGFGIIDAVTVLPVKFRLSMSGAPAAGSTWRWDSSLPCQLTDALTHHVPNSGMGTIADFPGPYTPPPPANVIDSFAGGMDCILYFDEPVILTAPLPALDDAILFDGVAPIGVQYAGSNGLQIYLSNTVGSGSTWQINRQPAWISTILTTPQGGVFP